MPAVNAVVPGSALLALVLGTLVYLLDRDWSSTLFLAPLADYQGAKAGVFGTAGLYLPSLLHAYAFALLIILAAPRSASARLFGAVGWFAIAACLEGLQALEFHPAGSFDHVGPAPGPTLSIVIQSYVGSGRFDAGDIVAAGVGCLAAYCAAGILEVKR